MDILHHRGVFVRNSLATYVGGLVDYYDRCNVDMWSLYKLDALAKELGHQTQCGYYYKDLTRKSCEDLLVITSDGDALKMAKIGGQYGVVDVFFDHPNEVSIF